MANAYKVLGQSAPTASTNTTLYTAPAATEVVANLAIASRDTVNRNVRVAVRPDGAALANEHYLLYDVVLPAGATLTMSGIAMDAADVVTVWCSGAGTFTLTGVEIT